ncbi:MAG: MarR family transcriptional regulator [Sulfurovum sp.]|nr:MAG: MarR family transcriptional regulator [Sulfurovum sp.]
MSSAFNPKEQALSLDAKLIYALERVSQIYRTLLWKTQVETGLSPIQSQILIYMLFHDDNLLSISAFAIEFSVTKATISDAFKTLEKKGLVSKEKDIVDKRRQVLQLTKEGIRLAEKIQNYAQPLDEILKEFPQEVKSTLFLTLRDMLRALNNKKLLAPLRMCTSCHYFTLKEGQAYCNLLETPLKDEEIRLDCPEYENRELSST